MKQTNNPSLSSNDSGVQPLTPEEILPLKRSYEENGYFLLKNVVSAERLTELHRNIVTEYDRAKSAGELFSGGGQMSGHLNCFPGAGSRFIYDTLEASGIVNLVHELDPKIDRLPNIGCNFNLPGSVTQHYHADRYYTGHFMIVNVGVVKTINENGAIDVIPGTHKKFYPYWKFALERPYKNSIRIPMECGDVLVRDSNVWHRGMPNKTSVARPMIAITWEDGGSKLEDPWSAENGKITFRPNWFRPTALGRLRERVFVTVPASYATYRFFASLTGKGYSG